MKRNISNWSEAEALDWPMDTNFNESFPAITLSGAMYFIRTILREGTFFYKAKLVGNKYQEPKRLGIDIDLTHTQSNAFISPDESYIIVPNGQSRDGLGSPDCYVCFRGKGDKWSEPYNLGKEVNTAYSKEWTVHVSPNSKYLFFMSDRGPKRKKLSRLYWVNGSVIEKF